MENIILAMKQEPKLELISNTDHSQHSFSFYKNIKIAIGRLKIRYSIFVIEIKNYDLILDSTFSNFVMFG